MKIIRILMVLLVSFAHYTCLGQDNKDQKYNLKFKVGSIPDLIEFNCLSETEKRMDSIYRVYDFTLDSLTKADSTLSQSNLSMAKAFVDNRSRVFLNCFTNNQPDSSEYLINESLPMPCNCYVANDTLFISMFIGFFGGLGFEIKLFNDSFQTKFFEYTDDYKPYKYRLSDTAFSEFISVKTKYQSLMLNEYPTYVQGQQLTGFLTFTSDNFYKAKYLDELENTYITGRLYFTCRTRQKMQWDK